MIEDLIKTICSTGLLIGASLAVVGLLCRTCRQDDPDAQGMAELLGGVLLSFGSPIFALSLLGLLL